MSDARHTLRVLYYAARCGLGDYASIFTLRTWLFGWFLRVLAQVVFFTLIGRLIGDTVQLHFLLVGNAVLLAPWLGLGAVASTIWERRAGTLPLLTAAPASPLVVLMGRSVNWVIDGVVSATGALLVVGSLFGLHLNWLQILMILPVIGLISLSSYALGIFLGALVLRVMDMRNVVSNLARAVIMTFCGVNVPSEFFPGPVAQAAHVLPLTNGLQAVRSLLAGEPTATMVGPVLLECLVGIFWTAAAVLTYQLLLEAGRREGTIDLGA